VEPAWVSIRLFEVEDFDRSQILLDPCTGFGRIAEAAKGAGYTVIAADIVDRGYPGCLVQDFLDCKSAPPTVVGNPPFKAVEAFARHALELGAPQGRVAVSSSSVERRSVAERVAAPADLAADAATIHAARIRHRTAREARRWQD
jgi:hypothetical protein